MFFDAGRTHFFRPLANGYRHAFLACLSDFYLRTHGAHADYGSRHTRETVRDRFEQLLQEAPALRQRLATGEGEEGGSRGARDLASHVLAELIECDWLVTPIDSATRLEVVQFSRAGKQFAGLLTGFSTPRLTTRARHLRVCANSLGAYLERSDPDDLLEAYNAAQSVIHDLSELIELIRDATRSLLSGATSLERVVPDLIAFLDMFDREIRPHFTVEGVDRHHGRILGLLGDTRAVPEHRAAQAEQQLNELEPRLARLRAGESSRLWLLDRIEDMVEAACSTKRPELIEALHTYQMRYRRLMRQSMTMRTAARESLTGRLDALSVADLGRLADDLAVRLAPARVRLLDEVSLSAGLRALQAREQREAPPLSVEALAVPEAERAAAFVQNAVAQSYALPYEALAASLREVLADRPVVRLSELHEARPTFTALQELLAWPGIAQGLGCRVRVADDRLTTDWLTSDDMILERAA